VVITRIEVQVQVVIGAHTIFRELPQFLRDKIIIYLLSVLPSLHPLLQLLLQESRTVALNQDDRTLIVQKQVEYSVVEVSDLTHVDVQDVRLQLPRFVHKLLQQFHDGVDDVLVLTIDQRKNNKQMLTEEVVFILFAGVLYYFDDLQNQRF
jgi:hypothetical protein